MKTAPATRKLATLSTCVAICVTGFFTASAPAQAADPYPSAPNCVVESTHATIQKGSSGSSVKEAQCWLNKFNYGLVVDGQFGTATDSAVRAFQKSKGLEVDGVVGPKTWNALIYGTKPPVDSRAQKVQRVINYARAQVGKPYVFGAAGPNSFDCSGLTLRSYQQAGITLPRYSGDQAAKYREVPASQRQVGDLMHWPNHVGIYAGNGKVIEAANSRTGVVERNVWGTPTYHRVIP